jgi:hypothetical protein
MFSFRASTAFAHKIPEEHVIHDPGAHRMKLERTHGFLAFLKNRLKLEDSELPVPGEWTDMGNTIGAIALRSHLLSLEQIENILDRQESEEEHQLFGQLAIDRGYLTPHQVDKLLAMQDFNRQFSLAGQLILRGILDMESLLNILREYSVAEPHTGAEQNIEDVERSHLPV